MIVSYQMFDQLTREVGEPGAARFLNWGVLQPTPTAKPSKEAEAYAASLDESLGKLAEELSA